MSWLSGNREGPNVLCHLIGPLVPRPIGCSAHAFVALNYGVYKTEATG